jgi:cell division protein FtsQ
VRAKGNVAGRRLALVLAPSLRSIAVGLALVAGALGGYVAARETSAFAVRDVIVEGASPRVGRQIGEVLSPLVGRSLVGLGADEVLGPVKALPEVRSASYDRAFPHTLVVVVEQERPAAVLRAGSRAWLVSPRGRVLREVEPRRRRRLARVWAPARTAVVVGNPVADASARRAVAAAALALRALRARVLTVREVDGQLAFVLAGGRELRLGDRVELGLKVAVANAILPRLLEPRLGGPTYLDVSVPERAVAGVTLKSEVEVEG